MNNTKRNRILGRVGALLLLAGTLGAAGSSPALAWGSWGAWKTPTTNPGTCLSSGAPQFTGMSVIYSNQLRTVWAMDPSTACQQETQAMGWPGNIIATSWNTTQTASAASANNMSHHRCRARYVLC